MSASHRTENRLIERDVEHGQRRITIRLYETDFADGRRAWIIRAFRKNSILISLRWCYTPTEARIIFMEATGGEVLPAGVFEEVA